MKKSILEGHKRIGKRLVPPMMQLPMTISTGYVNDMLPELIWIGLINERVGYAQGARILEAIVLAFDAKKVEEQEGNYALISSFKKLSIDQKTMINDALRRAGFLDMVKISIAPLIILYDECPLSFFGQPENPSSREELVAVIKQCVGKTIDKYDTPGIILQGSLLLTRLVTKTIHFPKGMDLPDLNSVINSPKSDEANRAAGFMRASALAEFGMLKVANSWAKHFWDRNFQLIECEHTNEQ
jgi:hypothetical protein